MLGGSLLGRAVPEDVQEVHFALPEDQGGGVNMWTDTMEFSEARDAWEFAEGCRETGNRVVIYKLDWEPYWTVAWRPLELPQ